MDILLWRHAEAFDARPGESDTDRKLTPKGLEQAARVGRWLDGVLTEQARVIASPAARTQQTAQALGRAFETVPALASGASVQSVLLAAGWPRGPGPVVVVGHQPTLGVVCAWLMAGSQQHWHVEKAGVWWLRSDLHHEQRADLVAMRTPDLL